MRWSVIRDGYTLIARVCQATMHRLTPCFRSFFQLLFPLEVFPKSEYRCNTRALCPRSMLKDLTLAIDVLVFETDFCETWYADDWQVKLAENYIFKFNSGEWTWSVLGFLPQTKMAWMKISAQWLAANGDRKYLTASRGKLYQTKSWTRILILLVFALFP